MEAGMISANRNKIARQIFLYIYISSKIILKELILTSNETSLLTKIVLYPLNVIE